MELINQHKKKIIITLLFIAIFGFVMKTKSQKNKTEKQILIERGTIIDAVYGIGTVTAEKTYQLKVAVAGTLSRVYVKEGDFVNAGAPLLEIGTIFSAPFGGVVTAIPYKLGETVFPQSTLLTLTDLKNLYLVVSLEQQGAIRIKPGQLVRLSFESMRGKTFRGRVRSIFSNEGTFIVHVTCPDLPPQILPGMTAYVGIEIQKKDNVILIPISALENGSIMLSRNGKTRSVPVGLGTIDAEMAELVTGDVQVGDRLILKRN